MECNAARPEVLTVLGEIMSEGVQASCGILNTLLISPLECQPPAAPNFLSEADPTLSAQDGETLCQVHLRFNGLISGTAVFSLDRAATGQLLERVSGTEVAEGMLDTLDAGTFSEIGSVVLDGVMASLSQVLEFNLIYQVPTFRQGIGPGVLPVGSLEPSTTLNTHLLLGYEDWQGTAQAIFYLEEGSCRAVVDRIASRTPEEC